MTNGEAIRNMDDKKLAGFLFLHMDCSRCPIGTQICKGSCSEYFEKWLASDASFEGVELKKAGEQE